MLVTTALSMALLASPAQAGKCDYLIKRADTVAPSALAKTFTEAARCDSAAAGDNFTRFMTRATDSETLVALSLAAIDADVWNPVWVMPGKISDYNTRDIISSQVGEACGDHPKVVTFLQGAYLGLRSLDFKQWDNAFISCQSPDLAAWFSAKITAPPASSYDEKYEALMDMYIKREGPGALDVLKTAAISATGGGPFESILSKMDESVAPGLGQTMSPENQAALEAALVEIAQASSPTQARSVADRLVAAGAEDSAAQLLPVVYPDRRQGGSFVWGGMSIERGDCKGVKTAVLHIAEISEPGKRWIVTDEAIPDLRAHKPKLKKCTPEDGDWPVVVSPEPLEPGGLEAWARAVGAEWAGQGYAVELKNEKGFALP